MKYFLPNQKSLACKPQSKLCQEIISVDNGNLSVLGTMIFCGAFLQNTFL